MRVFFTIAGLVFFTAAYACYRLPHYTGDVVTHLWMLLCGTAMMLCSFGCAAAVIFGVKVSKE